MNFHENQMPSPNNASRERELRTYGRVDQKQNLLEKETLTNHRHQDNVKDWKVNDQFDAMKIAVFSKTTTGARDTFVDRSGFGPFVEAKDMANDSIKSCYVGAVRRQCQPAPGNQPAGSIETN